MKKHHRIIFFGRATLFGNTTGNLDAMEIVSGIKLAGLETSRLPKERAALGSGRKTNDTATGVGRAAILSSLGYFMDLMR
jgi:hypothetical protein